MSRAGKFFPVGETTTRTGGKKGSTLRPPFFFLFVSKTNQVSFQLCTTGCILLSQLVNFAALGPGKPAWGWRLSVGLAGVPALVLLFGSLFLLRDTPSSLAGRGLLAEGRAELERLALVARKTTNAVLITDIERRVVWVNEGFTRITGYTLDEVRGRVPGSILQCGKTDRSAIATMRAAMNDHQGCRVELLNVAKDGREYWLDIEIQPMRDSGGVVTGFMAIESDITAAVRAREEIAASERRQHMIVAGADLGTWDWKSCPGSGMLN